MNDKEFAQFLALLSSTGGGDGALRYIRLYRRLEGFFAMKGVRDSVGATDAVIAVAYRRSAEGAVVPDVEKYSMGVARNIALERLRAERREINAFLGFIADLNNETGEA